MSDDSERVGRKLPTFGRVEIGPADLLYKALRPSPETIAAIERDELANAQGLLAIRNMMVGHVENWPEPKKFGTALALVDKALHFALRQRDEWKLAYEEAEKARVVMRDEWNAAENRASEARAQAMEEAARVCDEYAANIGDPMRAAIARGLAAAIRALANEKAATPIDGER